MKEIKEKGARYMGILNLYIRTLLKMKNYYIAEDKETFDFIIESLNTLLETNWEMRNNGNNVGTIKELNFYVKNKIDGFSSGQCPPENESIRLALQSLKSKILKAMRTRITYLEGLTDGIEEILETHNEGK